MSEMPAMCERRATGKQEFDARASPLFWFVRLETALEAGDFEAAADARRRLRDLGVDVVYRTKLPQMKTDETK
jgi:hypothetical protein